MPVRSALVGAFFLLVAHAGYGQPTVGTWRALPGSPDVSEIGGSRHDDVFFVNPSTGWVVNTQGQIWKTTDGGAAWTKQVDTGGLIRFRSVGFANELVGWAGTVFTPGSILFETRDGGQTWTNITDRLQSAAPAGVCGLWVVSEQVVYGSGVFFGAPFLISTRNGGLNWGVTNLGALAATLIDVHFLDERVGFVTGGTGANLDGEAVVLRTTNGGITWQRVFTSTRRAGISGEWGWKISFPTPEVGYVAVEYGQNEAEDAAKVLKTTDGGATWREILVRGSTETAGLQGIGFVSADVGWVSGRGTTSITRDAGTTWQQLAPESAQYPEGQLDGRVNRIRVLGDTLAYAIGERVYKYTTSPVSTPILEAPATPRAFHIDPIYPNPFDPDASPTTTIGYTLHRDLPVRIAVYDLQGRELERLVDRRQGTGRHTVAWDGRDASGRRMASGTYLVLFDVGESAEVKRMVVLD